MQLLFENRSSIVAVLGKVYFRQEQAKILPEPVMVGDTPTDRVGAEIYGSVLHDGGIFRMWYQSCAGRRDCSLIGYAESDDGLHWRKPKLGMVDVDGTDNNICNLGLTSCSVFVDPNASASHRYRATGFVQSGVKCALPGVEQTGYYTAHSADGLYWEADQTMPRWDFSDVITSAYHPGQQRAIVSLKRMLFHQGLVRRAIWQAEWAENRWSEAACALVPDDFDDVCAKTRGYLSGDYYGMGIMPAGQDTVGFLWQFRHKKPYDWDTGLYGTTDVSLVFQEGRHGRWLHIPGRPHFLSHADLPWTRGGIYTASHAIDVGDEQWLYITGGAESHAWELDTNWQPINHLAEQLRANGLYRIGIAHWPKDRLFGFESDPQGGIWLDLGELQQPVEFILNYTTRPGGSIRARLASWLPLSAKVTVPGYDTDDCRPLMGDNFGATVAWNDGTVIHPVPGQRMALYLEMDRAMAYAYDLRPCK